MTKLSEFKHKLQQFLAFFFWLFMLMAIFSAVLSINNPIWAAFLGMSFEAELLIIVFNLENEKVRR